MAISSGFSRVLKWSLYGLIGLGVCVSLFGVVMLVVNPFGLPMLGALFLGITAGSFAMGVAFVVSAFVLGAIMDRVSRVAVLKEPEKVALDGEVKEACKKGNENKETDENQVAFGNQKVFVARKVYQNPKDQPFHMYIATESCSEEFPSNLRVEFFQAGGAQIQISCNGDIRELKGFSALLARSKNALQRMDKFMLSTNKKQLMDKMKKELKKKEVLEKELEEWVRKICNESITGCLGELEYYLDYAISANAMFFTRAHAYRYKVEREKIQGALRVCMNHIESAEKSLNRLYPMHDEKAENIFEKGKERLQKIKDQLANVIYPHEDFINSLRDVIDTKVNAKKFSQRVEAAKSALGTLQGKLGEGSACINQWELLFYAHEIGMLLGNTEIEEEDKNKLTALKKFLLECLKNYDKAMQAKNKKREEIYKAWKKKKQDRAEKGLQRAQKEVKNLRNRANKMPLAGTASTPEQVKQRWLEKADKIEKAAAAQRLESEQKRKEGKFSKEGKIVKETAEEMGFERMFRAFRYALWRKIHASYKGAPLKQFWLAKENCVEFAEGFLDALGIKVPPDQLRATLLNVAYPFKLLPPKDGAEEKRLKGDTSPYNFPMYGMYGYAQDTESKEKLKRFVALIKKLLTPDDGTRYTGVSDERKRTTYPQQCKIYPHLKNELLSVLGDKELTNSDEKKLQKLVTKVQTLLWNEGDKKEPDSVRLDALRAIEARIPIGHMPVPVSKQQEMGKQEATEDYTKNRIWKEDSKVEKSTKSVMKNDGSITSL